MERIQQNENLDLIQTKKTVDWLVNNTTVSVFNPIDFTGYQRQIDNQHCQEIINYLLRKDFFLPTAIICATDDEFTEDARLRIVDGQHRINAFRLLREQNRARYDQIRNYEVPVIVMAQVDERLEIDTFVTINKTSKKVDTSLALVLKNKMNRCAHSADLTMPKAEFVAVELAQALNFREEPGNLWYDKILFEGNPKNTAQLISLNAFVRSTRVLINHLARKGLISLDWHSSEDIDAAIGDCYGMMLRLWAGIECKWPSLFQGEPSKRRIIQGAIGYSAFNKVLVNLLGSEEWSGMEGFEDAFDHHIRMISLDSIAWMPGNQFSKFTSESGYSIVARELMREMNINI